MKLDLDDLMSFAVSATESAGKIAADHFGSVAVEWKRDGSELTAADTAAEAFLRDTIGEVYPDHGIFGEEGSRVDRPGPFRWIIDPIDGTRSFAAGVPLFGVLLALEHESVPIIGCCHFPALGETLVAGSGAGCWYNGRRAAVSECDDLKDARLVTSGLEYWRDWATPVGLAGFDRLMSKVRFGRTWGDCFGYALVATGRVEMLADPACGAHWDYAPMVPIIREAGGRFTTLRGQAVSSWSSALASNGRVHEAAAECWRDATDDDAIQTAAIRARARS